MVGHAKDGQNLRLRAHGSLVATGLVGVPGGLVGILIATDPCTAMIGTNRGVDGGVIMRNGEKIKKRCRSVSSDSSDPQTWTA